VRIWAAALALVGLAASAARADMTADMERYFAGEKREGWVFAGVGALAAGGGVCLIMRDDPVARGASYPILAVAAVQLGAGVVLLARTDGQVSTRRRQIAEDGAAFKQRESARMSTVATQFEVLKVSEIGLIVGGLGLAWWGRREGHPRVHGAGLGLAAQASLMLVLDLFAAERARRYRGALDRFQPAATADGLVFSIGGAF